MEKDQLVRFLVSIVVILVFLGILSYMGLFDFSQFAPEKCDAGLAFACLDYSLAKWESGSFEPEVMIMLRNDLGTAVIIENKARMECPECPPMYNEGKEFCGLYGNPPVESIRVDPGEAFIITCDPGMTRSIDFEAAGPKETVKFSFEYKQFNRVFTSTVSGEVFAAVVTQ